MLRIWWSGGACRAILRYLLLLRLFPAHKSLLSQHDVSLPSRLADVNWDRRSDKYSPHPYEYTRCMFGSRTYLRVVIVRLGT